MLYDLIVHFCPKNQIKIEMPHTDDEEYTWKEIAERASLEESKLLKSGTAGVQEPIQLQRHHAVIVHRDSDRISSKYPDSYKHTRLNAEFDAPSSTSINTAKPTVSAPGELRSTAVQIEDEVDECVALLPEEQVRSNTTAPLIRTT
jgi:hypothetical protein